MDATTRDQGVTQMRTARLDWGIAGLGGIGRIHARCLTDAPFSNSVSRLCVAESNRETANRGAQLFPASEFVTDYRDLPRCHIIIIALPSPLHLEAVASLCGRADVLLVEKPLGVTHGESSQLVERLRDARQPAMCGLTGLYHPEFQAMYDQLPRIGELIRVEETLHEASAELERFLQKRRGVLTENGIHSFHRFHHIAQQLMPDQEIHVDHCVLETQEFVGSAGEDTARGRLVADSGPCFDFDIAFRRTTCDNGLPIRYETTVEGSRGEIRVRGWESCESTIDGVHAVHYQHPDGPLDERSHFSRIQLGIQSQLGACREFWSRLQSVESVTAGSTGNRDGLHFTIGEAVRAQELIEACY